MGHQPVLLKEVLHYFEERRLDLFVDGTVGAGGHAAAILERHPEIQTFVGIDRDPAALKLAQQTLKNWKQVILLKANFADFDQELDRLGIDKVSGMVFDLGASSMQFDTAERGFSFSHDGLLDMRMDPDNALTAAEIVNSWPEKELGKIFKEYGEEIQWRFAAKSIVHARTKEPITTTLQLVKALQPLIVRRRKKEIHPATLIFQALRIAVNRELENIETVLPKAIKRLCKGGRLAVISFHSLEDRLVKNAFRYAASDKQDTTSIGAVFLSKTQEVDILTKKPVIPSSEEVLANPRSRSAKLRVVEKR